MCYSAQIQQALDKLRREHSASVDYEQMVRMFLRRLNDRTIRITRGFEANFDNPRSPDEKRIKDLIDQHRASMTTKFEQDLFAQKKRLADAERKLKLRETRAALNERRIATSKIGVCLEKLALLRGTQPHPDDDRIFPFSYAPIIVNRNGENRIELARYHLRQPGRPASVDKEKDGLYNARRDNLERFWRGEFGRTHALLIVNSFYENVDRQGTNVVLHYQPRPANQMLVACLYGDWSDGAGNDLLSFAAITDEPPEEIRATGHDRCIINLRQENIAAWLTPGGRSNEELQAILADRQQPYYEHQVMAA